ncbi:TadE/TadG family type IV pilus assembly protein [Cohnella sp. GCM10027633]|uniref:TadE/TadG family type IV pilus assembly protein n=1 Tax=unclassified Cohnella TaxID=2636738 RepID=UPI0036259DB5
MTAVRGERSRAALALWRDRSGAMTLEASMVLPCVMMLTIVVILFALYVSQASVLYYRASVAAERSAFGWSNSAKEAKTGAYPSGQYDGLYWRLKDDALLQGLFGVAAGGSGTVEVQIVPGTLVGRGASAADKLARVGASMPESVSGEMTYRNIGFKRTVSVQARSSRLPDALISFGGREHATADVSALVVEPTELIRSFDLVRYYAEKMKTAPQDESAYRGQAAEALRERGAAAR